MLKNIPSILSPQLLRVLCEMGHGDEIVLADGNFPAKSIGKNAIVVRADGHGVTQLLDAILTVMPLDQYTKKNVALMEIAPQDNACPDIWNDYKAVLNKYETGAYEIDMTERFAFYERAKTAYAIIATSEAAIYANILLKKGVV